MGVAGENQPSVVNYFDLRFNCKKADLVHGSLYTLGQVTAYLGEMGFVSFLLLGGKLHISFFVLGQNAGQYPSPRGHQAVHCCGCMDPINNWLVRAVVATAESSIPLF